MSSTQNEFVAQYSSQCLSYAQYDLIVSLQGFSLKSSPLLTFSTDSISTSLLPCSKAITKVFVVKQNFAHYCACDLVCQSPHRIRFGGGKLVHCVLLPVSSPMPVATVLITSKNCVVSRPPSAKCDPQNAAWPEILVFSRNVVDIHWLTMKEKTCSWEAKTWFPILCDQLSLHDNIFLTTILSLISAYRRMSVQSWQAHTKSRRIGISCVHTKFATNLSGYARDRCCDLHGPN